MLLAVALVAAGIAGFGVLNTRQMIQTQQERPEAQISDAVLMDVQVPVMDGYTAAARLSQQTQDFEFEAALQTLQALKETA